MTTDFIKELQLKNGNGNMKLLRNEIIWKMLLEHKSAIITFKPTLLQFFYVWPLM